jgi:GntR family transcriptional regulator
MTQQAQPTDEPRSDRTGDVRVADARPHPSVSRQSRVPLYHQVESDIRDRILTGEWEPRHRIPSEVRLCELYGASRITVRRALSNLVQDGLLVRQPGRGTFVRQPHLTAGPRGLTSYSEEMAALGFAAGARVLSIGIQPAPSWAAERLRLPSAEPVLLIERLRTADGEPMGLQTVRLPAARFPGLEDEDLEDRSLYGVLAQRFAVTPGYAHETFHVMLLESDDATALETSPGACAFRVQRLTFDSQDVPYELTTSIMRGDRYEVQLTLPVAPAH